MPLSCTLLVYFEKPPVSSAAWGHVVAAGLSHGRDSKPDHVLPWLLAPSPFLPRGLSPHILTPSSGTTPSARRGKGQVPQRGLWGGGWSLVGNMEKVGSWGWPPVVRAQPCPPRPPLLQAWPLVAQHPQAPGSSHHCWGCALGGVICSPIHGFLQSDLRGP